MRFNDPNFEQQLSFFGWEDSIEHSLFNYIEGYKYAATAVYDAYKEAASTHSIEKQDTICYPLVFLYRHITELYLKYIYIVLLKPDEEQFRNYINCGHKLNDLWRGIKDTIVSLGDRVSENVNIAAIEKYINEISENDYNSFNYRYPVTKNATLVHSSPKYLDIDNLESHMKMFFEYLDSVLYNVKDQWVDDEFNEEFNNVFNHELVATLPFIKKLFLYLQDRDEKKKINKRSHTKTTAWLEMSDIEDISLEERDVEYRMLKGLTENQKTLLIILYWAGKTLKLQNLASSKEERKRDIYKILFNACNSDVAFDNNVSPYKNNVLYDITFGSLKTIEYMQNILKEFEIDYAQNIKETIPDTTANPLDLNKE